MSATIAGKTCKPFLRRCVRIVLIVALLYSAFGVWNWWRGPIRPLIFSTSEIEDYYDDSNGGITGDFVRCIRARCSKDAFLRYAKQQGLSEQLTEDHPSTIPGWSHCPKPWWTPPQSLSGAFFNFRNGGSSRLLAYSDGYLYYDICVW